MTEPLKDERLLDLVFMGHPILRMVADPVPATAFGTPALREFAERLIDTMRALGGVGLAAPQVGEALRCFAYYVPAARDKESLYLDEEEEEELLVEPRVLINPQYRHISSHKEEGWEGCLSIPEIRGLVPRYTHIKVEAVDVDGNPLRFEAEDFHARVIQHEYDHLDGILFLDRMENMRSLAFEEEWMRYALGIDPDELEQREGGEG